MTNMTPIRQVMEARSFRNQNDFDLWLLDNFDRLFEAEKQIKEAQKNAGNIFGDRSELRAPPGRGVAGGTSTQLVDALGRPVDQAGNLISPEAAANTAKRDEEIKRANDVATQTARQMMTPISIGKVEKPKLLEVPERADLAMEMEAARGIAGSMYAMPADADKTLDQILKSDRETLAKQGYDFDLIKNMVAETRAEREKIPAQRKEAANLRLLEAGLAIMGGTSPFAFVNIGKGGSEAAKGFNEDMKEFRKLDREYRKELQQLQSMQNQETLMLTTEGKRKYERIQDRVEQTKDKRANAMYQIGQNMVNQVSRERETAQTLNSAIDRTVYQTQAELAKAEAQMKNQMGIASAQIAAQERAAGKPAAEVQAVRAYAESSGKPYHEAYREMMQARQEPKTRAQLEKEFMENIILQRQYGTLENYMKSQTGGGSTPESLYKKYGLEPK